MLVKTLSPHRAGTKSRYLCSGPSKPRDFRETGRQIFDLMDRINPHRYNPIILAWPEVQSWRTVREIFDSFSRMLMLDEMPLHHTGRFLVGHVEPPSAGSKSERSAGHGAISMVHLPTGKSMTPYLHSRDCNRVDYWARGVEKARGWPGPRHPSSKRVFRFLSPTRSKDLCDLVGKNLVPDLIGRLKRAGGKPLSIHDRCRFEFGGQIVGLTPTFHIKRREECVHLAYRSAKDGRLKNCLVGGPLFYHGPVWWENGCVHARRENPPRPRPGSAKQIEQQRLYLRRLTAEGRAIHERNLPDEFRPLLQSMQQVAGQLRETSILPGIEPRLTARVASTPAAAKLTASPKFDGPDQSILKAANELEAQDYDSPTIER